MSQKIWDEETFEHHLNNSSFEITDYGPLHYPINSFEIKRNNKKELILTTFSNRDSKKDAIKNPDLPSGTIHSLNETITFTSSYMKVIAKGVWIQELLSEPELKTQTFVRKEISWIDTLESIPEDRGHVHQLIEWVENLDDTLYILPHSLTEEKETSTTRIFDDKATTLKQCIKQKEYISGTRYLGITINGHEIFIKPFKKQNKNSPNSRGFILYKKFLCEDERRKIRECLSFAFGLPIVYLGHTLLSVENKVIGFKAVTPHIFDESIFQTLALPPAPVGNAFLRMIDPTLFSRMVNALMKHYDELNFRQLSWDYWHARFSPTHTQPVLLGACIEAIQNAYKSHNKSKLNSKLLNRERAKNLRKEFVKIIDSMQLCEEEKRILFEKASDLNKLPQRLLNERFFAVLSLDMSDKEKEAWNRRNEAAHGKKRSYGGHADLMHDVNMLMNIIHRIIISITKASTQYVDCYTPGYPIRQLNESVDVPIRFYLE